MMDEIEILRKLPGLLPLNDRIAVGAGDDCAVINMPGGRQLLAAADQVIENVHFLPDTPPRLVGRKLMNRNLSDIAAMGGTPLTALLTVAVCGRDSLWIEELISGAAEAGRLNDVPICGGDTASLPHDGIAASLTILGEVPAGEAVLRSGARPGDALYVTGEVGNSFYSQHHLTFSPRLAEGRFLRGKATAMLDISDGVLLDARRLARASQVDLKLDSNLLPLRSGAKLPNALSDGEDYELLFTAPPGLEKLWRGNLAKVTRIGEVLSGSGRVIDANGDEYKLERSGYEH